MARGTTRTVVRTTTTEGSDGKTGDIESSNSPLFAAEDIKDGRPVEKITVSRVAPNEGHLDTIEASATEDDIRDRWGGGTFQLRAYANGRIAKHREIRIAGDPIMVGKAASADYYRKRGLPDPNAPAGTQLDLPTLLNFMKEQGKEGRTAEVESMERRRQIDAEAEDRRRRWEQEMDEKRRREDLEREERRRRDDEERDRRRAQDEERRAREAREFQMQMQQAQSANTAATMALMQEQMKQTLSFLTAQNRPAAGLDPTEAILKGVNLVQTVRDSVGGGESKDLLATVVEQLPDMLGQAAQAAKGVVSEIRGNPGTPAQGGAAAAAPSALPADKEAEAIARRLLSEGRDPAEWFGRYSQQLESMKQQAIAQQGGQKAVGPQAPAAPATSPAPEAAQAPAAPAPQAQAAPAPQSRQPRTVRITAPQDAGPKAP